MKHRILELYSGIGGMHCAWKESKINGEIVAAIDINTIANKVYQLNFPSTNLMNRNIQSLTIQEINNLNFDTILMSPPCQPFTRNGKYLDENDPRTNSFIHLIELLDQFETLQYMLIENVKGFECSNVRDLLIEKLKECHFQYQEFLLCPSSFGIPNSRLRYYCIAKKSTSEWSFTRNTEIMRLLPKEYGIPYSLENIIDKDVSDKFQLSSKLLKRGNILDITHKESRRSCCFTKAYTHYLEGMGSVYTDATPELVDKCYERANTFEVGSDNFIETLKQLKLRFFTPKEALLLMSFPNHYQFPETISLKQCYRLVGNSINVKVVSELLKLLFNKYL